MGNLTGVFEGKKFGQPKKPVTDQIKDKMSDYGLDVPDVIHIDGQLHRFKNNSKGKAGKGDKPGWYIFYPSTITSGAFGCWRSDINVNFREDIGRTLSIKEEAEHARRIKEAKDLSKQKEERIEKVSTGTAELIWDGALGACPEHPYLKRKGIEPCGARVTTDGRLIVPMYDENFELQSLQYIGQDGEKRFHVGAKAAGAHYRIGATEESQHIFISEGFATAATIHEVTQSASIVAYSASNIPCIAKLFKEKFPDHKITVVADNDSSGVGKKYAEIAVKDHGVSYVMPPVSGMDANDYEQDGRDLLLLLMPDRFGWLVQADDFCSKPAPIKWLVKGWLQQQALMMVHGPSGGGKTFVVLDWCLRIASKQENWLDKKVKPGGVVYLAGEGHHGLKGRVAAWKQHNKPSEKMKLWLSKGGCDLNTHAGYQRVVDQVSALREDPSLIVVDTLHRFLDGDENSSQDAKTMLDACNKLMNHFNCSVLLVHHTGVSSEAQHRARGSSAWRGALDIEISVSPLGEGGIQLVQRKNKDAEQSDDKFLKLEKVEIDGWFDEDEEQITSAVIVEGEAIEGENPSKKEPKQLAKFKKMISDAMIFACDLVDGVPEISCSALRRFLIDEKGYSENTARKMMKPSVDGSFAQLLTNHKVVSVKSGGSWFLMDDELIAKVLLLKGKEL